MIFNHEAYEKSTKGCGVIDMSYKEKIRDLRNSAQETQAANKIIDKLTELKAKNNLVTSYRWIWELIQNAKDCVDSTGNVDIEIIFSHRNRILEFKHNGKLFATENIVFLVEQVSTKERSDAAEKKTTGKFGTGFLTTHLLSERVNVSGYLHDNGENPARFSVDLDRTGKTKDAIINSIKSSCEQLEKETREVGHEIDRKQMNTCFKYYLDENGIRVAELGLQNFLKTAPYVFAFVEKINRITVNIDDTINSYARIKEGDTNFDKAFVSRVRIESRDDVNIFCVQEDGVYIAAEVIQRDGINYIAPYDAELPKLFCDFPLLGTEDFAFPAVVNCSFFEPDEPRSGVYLTDRNSGQNKEILQKACSLYIEMVGYFANRGYQDIHNIVSIPSIISKEWLDTVWYNDSVLSWLKRELSQIPFFKTFFGNTKALIDANGDHLYLSKDEDPEVRSSVWRLSSVLFPDRHVIECDIDSWYHSLWEESKNYGVKELILDAERIGSLQELGKRVTEPIRWLNELINLIFKKCGSEFNSFSFEHKIFPNQNGDFCSISTLKIDYDIDEAFKNAALKINMDFRKQLLDRRIVITGINNMRGLPFNEAVHMMEDGAQGYYTVPYDFYKDIISLKGPINQSQDTAISIYSYFYHNDPVQTQRALKSSDRLLQLAIKNWNEKLCVDISRCEAASNLISFFQLRDEKEVISWISRFAQHVVACGQSDLMDKYAILPNQNGILKKRQELNYESNLIPDILKDACLYAGTDIREELIDAAIEHRNIIYRKIVLDRVAGVITSYVRNHKNQISFNQDGNKTFHETYLWLRGHKEDPEVQSCFEELLAHLYWFYNDDEISESIEKAAECTSILQRYGITDLTALDQILSSRNNSVVSNGIVSEEILCQYAIESEEDLRRLIEGRILGEEFLHDIEHSAEKYLHVQQILKRSHDNIFSYLESLDGYDVSDSVDIHKTIFTVRKDGTEIYIIARPSDYGEVILYYAEEYETMDLTKDFELWVEDGISKPQKLTFGRILKLTGVNRIPLRRLR